jgi:hypothetical protein
MPRTSTWKSTERNVAATLGGTRTPVTGRQRGDSADIDHPYLSIEVKHKGIVPDWIRDAIDQAVKSVRGEKLPIAVVHQARTSPNKDLVIMEMPVFLKFYEKYIEEKGEIAA